MSQKVSVMHSQLGEMIEIMYGFIQQKEVCKIAHLFYRFPLFGLLSDDSVPGVRTEVTSHHCRLLLPEAGTVSRHMALQPYSEQQGRVLKVCQETNEEEIWDAERG